MPLLFTLLSTQFVVVCSYKINKEVKFYGLGCLDLRAKAHRHALDGQ